MSVDTATFQVFYERISLGHYFDDSQWRNDADECADEFQRVVYGVDAPVNRLYCVD